MPDVGRFFNIDPLSEKYSYQSPYNFSEDRVIDARELEGLEAKKLNDNNYEFHVNPVGLNSTQLATIKADAIVASGIISQNGVTMNVIVDSKASYNVVGVQNVFFDKDDKGNLVAINGKTMPLGNPIDGTVKYVLGLGDTLAHELLHAMGLDHIWVNNPNTNPVTNTPANRNNVMNSGANPDPNNTSDLRTNLTTDQTEIMKRTVDASQSRLPQPLLLPQPSPLPLPQPSPQPQPLPQPTN